MKLEYRILWFEDDQESVSDFIDPIENNLKEEGFILKICWGPCTKQDMKETVKVLQAYNPYDLIVFDYDLGDGVTGEELAQMLRSEIWTEIVYYSANRSFDDLSKGMVEHKVEGVFCATRQNLEERLWNIIDSQIKRICDLNNMRGIILDSMSEIDYAIRKFLSERCKLMNDQDTKDFAERITAKIQERLDETTVFKDMLDHDHKEIVNAVYNYNFVDFELIRNRLYRLFHDTECFKDKAPLHKIQQMRNKFAHQPSKFNTEKNLIELIDQKTNKCEELDYEKFRIFRQMLFLIRKDLIKIGALKEE